MFINRLFWVFLVFLFFCFFNLGVTVGVTAGKIIVVKKRKETN